ncbi:MAG: hypothetical protein OEM51_07250 [Gammaproteobacteria bacterium]|nr:hypothetical protein [Gammaproteobacteria bacterium]MDH3430635.1 hypothetical protein [Gammaproteobacteria bacterium]
MNCIASLNVCILLLCTACGAPASESLVPEDPMSYRIDYQVDATRTDGTISVAMKLSQARALLREMTMRPDSRISKLEADGTLESRGDSVSWLPPATGGTIRWDVDVAHRRNGDGYDAWLGANWGLFRAEDIIPRASTRTLKGSRSETWLTLALPRGWSAITQYFKDDGAIRIDNPQRRFDQPTGWMVIGNLGVRRDMIAGTRVAVAGPVDSGVRRVDTLALLNWTLPELARVVPDLPRRLTIVSAGDPMWRGGLSAPQSLYVHADRPLISENGTSTLLHEVMHLTLALSAAKGYDWIVEGMAEYYSLELLHRSGTISDSRYALAKARLADWADSAATLCRTSSTGATTALAVRTFSALDKEIRNLSDGEANFDDVVRRLTGIGDDVDLILLNDTVTQLTGSKSDVLHIDKLPGCRNIAVADRET